MICVTLTVGRVNVTYDVMAVRETDKSRDILPRADYFPSSNVSSVIRDTPPCDGFIKGCVYPS